MFSLGRTTNRLVVDPSSMSSNQDKIESKTMLPQTSFQNTEANFLKIKKELVSLCPTPLNLKKETEQSLTSTQSPFYPSFGFPMLVEARNTKSQKRKSDPGSKSCKKIRTKCLLDAPNEDQNLDKDLMGLVGSIDTDKKLDSDSSEDTIILDDDSTHNSPLSKQHESNLNSKEKNIGDNPPTFSNFSSLFSNPKFQINNESKNLGIKNTYYFSEDNKQPYSGMLSQLSSKHSDQQNEPFLKLPQSKIDDQRKIYETKTSLLRNTLSFPITIGKLNIPEVSFPPDALPNIELTVKNSKSRSKNSAVKRQRRSPNECSKSPKESSISNIKWALSKSSNPCHKSNFQSVYASMGLEEDLCDSDNKLPKMLNIACRESCKYNSHVNKINNVPLGVTIKVEKDDPSYMQGNSKGKSEQLIDNCHVSMTFEAESPGEDEDFEDDLPLLALKNKKTANEVSAKIDPEMHSADATVAFDPSLFIKKELIEGEIVSESQAVSSKNVVSASDSAENFVFNNTSMVSQPNSTGVKIKTEPCDTDFFSNSVAKINTLLSSKADSDQVFENDNTHLPAVTSKKKSRSSVLLPQVDKHTDRKHVSSNFNSIKSKSPDKLNAQTISSTSAALNSSNQASNLIESDVSSTYSESVLFSSNLSHNFQLAKSPKTSKTKKMAKTSKRKTNPKKKTDAKTAPKTSVASDLSEKNLNLDISYNDSDSDSDFSSHQGDSSAAKNNRKKTKAPDNVDENLPITLLLKRQTSDANSPDSFSCTDISNKSANENNETSGVRSEHIVKNKNPDPILPKHANINSSSELTVARQTKKKSGKKKQAKGKTKKNLSSVESGHLDPLLTDSKIPTSNDGSNINSSQSLIDTPAKNTDLSLLNNQIKENAISSKELQENSAILEFEKEHPQGELDEDNITSCSSVKNIEESFINDNSTDYLSISKVSDSFIKKMQQSAALSTLASECVESSPTSAKKRKKVRRSNGWYKKKKKKKKQEDLSLENTSEIHEYTTSVKASDNLIVPSKIPVVIVKKFLSADITASKNLGSHLDLEKESNLLEDETLDREQIKEKPKSKRRRGSSVISKRKKSRVKLNRNSQRNVSSLSNVEAESNKEIEDEENVEDRSQQNKSPAAERNDGSCLSEINNEFDHQSTDGNGLNSSTAVNPISSKRIFPSLDVDEIAQEIATFDALINRNENNSVSLRISENNNPAKQNQSVERDPLRNSPDCLVENHDVFKSSNATLKTASSNNVCNFPNIEVKKEINSCSSASSKNSVNQSMQSLVSARINIEAARTSLLDTTCIKKEKDAEKQSFIAEKTGNGTLISNSETSSHRTNTDSLGLSIKKEICNTSKGAQSDYNIIKDQNDLIQRIYDAHASKTSQQQSNNSKLDAACHESSTADLNDEEIQIVPVEKEKNKNVPVVDLTDDIPRLQQRTAEMVNASLMPDYNKTQSLTSENISDSVISKENTPSSVETRKVSSDKNVLPPLQINSENIESLINSIKNEKDISTCDSADKEIVDSETGNDEKSELFKLRNKYVEYFAHPFPPSVVLYNKKQRKRKAIYSRIDSNVWNLSINEVGARLKHSENVPQKKLGDIIKIEKYPVSNSEIECYHRILGVAPSRKLLSKCYSPNKFSTNIKKDVNNFLKTNQKDNFNESKPEGNINYMTCTLSDIIQGITATKMLYSDSNAKNNSTVYERNCPSTDTRDSFESHVSNASNFSTSMQQNKGMKTVSNLFTDRENELGSPSRDACSSGRNSTLSCAASDIHDSLKYDNSNMDFSVNCSLQNKQLPNLVLPNTTFDNAVDGIKTNLSFVDTFSTEFNPFYKRNDTVDNSLSSVPDQSEQSPATVQNTYVSELAKPITNVFDVPVDELRNILLTANNVGSNTIIGNDDNATWKSAATFEYNHTQSTPLPEVDSNKYKNTQNLKCHDFDNFTDHLNSNLNRDLDNSTKDNQEESSDDDYVDAEPVNDEYDLEESETTTDSKEQMKEDPVSIPKYKSKWEKIMERKSQEFNEKEKISEHLLQDCFPVSSQIKPPKTHVSGKSVLKSQSKELQKSDTKEKNKTTRNPPVISPQRDASKNKLVASKGKSDQSVTNSKSEKSNNKKELKGIKKRVVSNEDSDVDTTDLFVPDKVIKVPCSKKVEKKTNEKDKATKRCYGNRVTNRGAFLTEPKSSPLMKSIKIPKKKKSETNKKPVNVRSEEYHKLVKSPEINIEPTWSKSKKAVNKPIGAFKSPLSYNSPSTSTHFVRTKRMQDKQWKHLNLPYSKRGNAPRKYAPNFNNSSMHPYARDGSETFQGRKLPLLDTPRPIPSILEDQYRNKTPFLDTPHSFPGHYNDKNASYQQPQVMNNSPSTLPKFSAAEKPSALEKILSVINSNPGPEIDNNIPPVHGNLNASRDNIFSPFRVFDSAVKQNINPLPNLNVLIGKVPPSTSLDPRLTASRINSVPAVPMKNQDDPSFSPNSPIANSPITPPSNTSLSSRKATCLVPQHLKTLVGHEIIETEKVRLLMLEWNVDWLMEQQKLNDPPPISNTLKKVVSSYENFEDYYNTYFPLMLLETWQRIYISWTHLNQQSPYSCQITSYSVKSHYVSVECQTIFNTDIHPKGVFPDEGSILMVKYSTKSNEFIIKILGYVTHVKTRRFNSVTDSQMFSSLKLQKDTKPEVLQILTLTFMGAYNSEDIDKRQPIHIHVLCNVKPTLKQNDALLSINKSPLQRSILNPVADGLRSLALIARNSSPEKVDDCVRDITKGILSPHPLPLLTVVRAKPESDRLNIIPKLIEKMKSSYRTKVLLCVRTVRALGDIAANICLNQSLKLVIINKRCDTNPQFQKFLLDELVSAELKKTAEEDKLEKVNVKNELFIKTKKQILSDCDVVLSLVRNCHDDFMAETFTEKECIPQMCCIVDEANLCTEPETLIPILHGISKLILIGDPDYSAKVLSKSARSYDYSQSFFQRAYDLDLLED